MGYVIQAGLMIVFWPFLMLFLRFISTRKSAIASAQEKFDMKGDTTQDLIVSARAQIIEVSIESSFQPLLQLYLLLPTLLQFKSYDGRELLRLMSIGDVFEKFEHIQFWAILTSIISLSWSFTFYQSIQKNGALDFGSNPVGRSLLLLANLLQISSRLLALIIYAYTFGDGNFWPMIATVMVHIFFMSVLHYFISDEWELKSFRKKHFKIMYHCLINEICNLYVHNWIVQICKTKDLNRIRLSQENTKPKRQNIKSKHVKLVRKVKKDGTVFRQTLFDAIFVIENLIILLLAHFTFYEELPSGLMIFIALSQYVGIGLKTIYYSKFHIWSNSFTFEKSKQQFKDSSRNSASRIKSIGSSFDAVSKIDEQVVIKIRNEE